MFHISIWGTWSFVWGAKPTSPHGDGTVLRFVCFQGRNEGAQFSGRRKVPIMSQVLSSVQHICFRKISVSNMGASNSLLAPGAIWPRYGPGCFRSRLICAPEICEKIRQKCIFQSNYSRVLTSTANNW